MGLMICPCFVDTCLAESETNLVIDRSKRELRLSNKNGKVLLRSAVGIGRGGLAQKKNMNDCISPAAHCKVDLVLYKNPAYNAISSELKQKYNGEKIAMTYLYSKADLSKLFANMNSIDFNGDGKADSAYGAGYIGLDSRDAPTGPKLSNYKGTVYWFSIALHGTSNEKKNIGFANSGGCIQLPETVLKELIEQGRLKVGSELTIK
ncbi:MAG: L,D-transpeptidase [Candidatus Obscuribacterales bacterium]|nr:L,D-transpeptidase [Candidatus Obscuribacterales bacterium]